MQEPLLHPSDTIYHAPFFPSLLPCVLFTTQAFSAPHHARETKKKKLPYKNLAHSRANDWALNAKPVTFQQDITNGLSLKAPKATS